MKIGLLGGSFDPIHNGHINMAISAWKEYELDEVWLIPAGHSPNKDETQMTSKWLRLEMCQKVSDDYPMIHTSDIEVKSLERSYTYRTLEKLTAQYPEYEFYFIMGADSLDYLEKWYHPEIICKLAKILVVSREGFSQEDMEQKITQIQDMLHAQLQIVHCPRYDAASRNIRKMLENHEDVSNLLPNSVQSYIIEHHLYGME